MVIILSILILQHPIQNARPTAKMNHVFGTTTMPQKVQIIAGPNMQIPRQEIILGLIYRILQQEEYKILQQDKYVLPLLPIPVTNYHQQPILVVFQILLMVSQQNRVAEICAHSTCVTSIPMYHQRQNAICTISLKVPPMIRESMFIIIIRLQFLFGAVISG